MRFLSIIALAAVGAQAAVVRQVPEVVSSALAEASSAVESAMEQVTSAVSAASTAVAASTEAPATTTEAPATTTEPVECKTIAELLVGNDKATLILALVQELNLTDRFNATGRENLTVFLPTDDALVGATLPNTTAELFLTLSAHVVPGLFLAADLKDGDKLEPFLLGAELPVSVVDGAVKIQDATVTEADLIACNGVVHIIDKPLNATLPFTTPAEGETPVSTETPPATETGTATGSATEAAATTEAPATAETTTASS